MTGLQVCFVFAVVVLLMAWLFIGVWAFLPRHAPTSHLDLIDVYEYRYRLELIAQRGETLIPPRPIPPGDWAEADYWKMVANRYDAVIVYNEIKDKYK